MKNYQINSCGQIITDKKEPMDRFRRHLKIGDAVIFGPKTKKTYSAFAEGVIVKMYPETCVIKTPDNKNYQIRKHFFDVIKITDRQYASVVRSNTKLCAPKDFKIKE